MSQSEELNLLLIKLENLQVRHHTFEREIEVLKEEIKMLQKGVQPLPKASAETADLSSAETRSAIRQQEIIPAATLREPETVPDAPFSGRFGRVRTSKSDFEKFIGENLISKIGILILIIGVAIGARYAIDHDLVSPLTRIILGYLTGAVLMVFALRLKARYENFSAVLVSGGIAILYFMTYAAYEFYGLIPQLPAFVLMVIFTGFSVLAATRYNMQVIAHIGLVGAYAVPFLLSDGSGRVLVLFTYMAIINVGILVLSLRRYWKSLLYVSFGITWLIFLAWRLDLGTPEKYFGISLFFSLLFFVIFYIASLAYKISRDEPFGTGDVIVIFLNSCLYYGLGYFILSANKTGAQLLGLFTLANAVIHFTVSLFIYKRKLADKKLFYLVLALVIAFITLAVPVQLDGNWVTIFWAVEAAVLLYLYREKRIVIYQKLCFPLIIIAFLSLLQDWWTYFDSYRTLDLVATPFLNANFYTSCLFTGCFTWMFIVNSKEEVQTGASVRIERFLKYLVPAILLIVSYMTFHLEIVKYFDQLTIQTRINVSTRTRPAVYETNQDYGLLKTAWAYIYAMLFALLLTFLNIKKLKSHDLSAVIIVLNVLLIGAFLTQGLYNLSLLRDSYLLQSSKYFASGAVNIAVRYVSLVFFGLLLLACHRLTKSGLTGKTYRTSFDYLLYIALLWIISSEFINILALARLSGSYKLGISILWGVYAVFLIIMGLAKNKKHLRIGAIVLFGLTLLKLFFFDIAYLGTIAKTVVFVSLGVLLLIISFLYNKYKHLITDNARTED